MTTDPILRKFGPRPPDHPDVAPRECYACKEPFKAGDYTTLITLGPGGDAEERERCREGRAYNAIAIEIHWECATGEAP